ncbi:ATP-binding cassette domain-containing protein [Janthinobacterium sp. PC23-8]|uniref:ATP-binding cassette domain-containing protein n=1 Tax=Janthinobacterium sp. PC23-8 TaxID=2012679 RepID=UPI00159605C2|nr:ATP-binding cassette domain-containing protein [Janthinobacterium sp. PC23-8]
MPALLQLDRLSYVLPDGTSLFHQLLFSFTPQRIGLVGANGVGKSVLARLLAGETLPTSGAVRGTGSVVYVAQELSPAHFPTVASLAGADSVLAALDRIAFGSIDEADYALVGEHWDAGVRLQQALDEIGLGHLLPDTPATSLSGGERMKVALAAELYAQTPPQLLLLDEPDNHLDLASLQAMERMLAQYRGALLVVSHDEAFLQQLRLDEPRLRLHVHSV